MSNKCSICLEVVSNETNTATLECNHTFHYKCVYNWNKLHTNCPLCRTEQVGMNISDVVVVDASSPRQLIYRAESISMIVHCIDCHGIIESCEDCDNLTCHCRDNHEHFRGKNIGTTDHHICLECLDNRDRVLLEVLLESGPYDIYNNTHIYEIFEKYYKNDTEQDQRGFRMFKSESQLHDFIDYAVSIYTDTICESLDPASSLFVLSDTYADL
jgi:hypothetical protein